ncbi:MAG: (2Fe-2S) ferredoxin domain-containing protein, partial [Oscillospiraceae bacterium]|nr:(2Fe-2S) ferredoxin domain-containing protein [Oscillospiraceae bacterium]
MKSLDEIKVIRDEMAVELQTRDESVEANGTKYRKHVLICGGTGCTSSGSAQIEKTLAEELEKNGLTNEVQIVKTGCFGLCALGPIMIVYPEGSFYAHASVDRIPEIVEEHLKNGNPVKKYLYEETVDGDTIKSLNET